MTTSKEPHMLVTDDDGHWYLMPEREVPRFEAIIEMAGDEYIPAGVQRELDGYTRYAIGDPSLLRLYEWEAP